MLNESIFFFLSSSCSCSCWWQWKQCFVCSCDVRGGMENALSGQFGLRVPYVNKLSSNVNILHSLANSRSQWFCLQCHAYAHTYKMSLLFSFSCFPRCLSSMIIIIIFFFCCLFLLRATRRMRWWTTVALHCVDSWTAFVIIFLLCVWCMLSAVLYAFTLAQFVCVQTASSHIRSVFMVYSANDMASNRMTPKRKMTKSNSFSNGFLYWIERVRERNWLNVRCLCSILW